MLKTIFLKRSSKEPVIFTDTAVSYGDTEIRYDEATGLGFQATIANGSFNALIRILSPRSKITIRAFEWGIFKSTEKLQSDVSEIYSTAFERLRGPLVERFVEKIDSGGSAVIGHLQFTGAGIVANGLISKRVAEWRNRPSAESARTSNSIMRASGLTRIYCRDPVLGKITTIATITSQIENGCFVPTLIDAMNAKVQK